MEFKNKCDESDNGSDWNHFKITQTTPEQRTKKALSQGTIKNSHTGHCTSNAESSNVRVKLQNIK